MSWIGREALARVLQSLLSSELSQARKGRHPASEAISPGALWPEALQLREEGPQALGCDSIELLWLASAVNEMFCLYDAHVESSLLAANSFGDWVDIVQRGWNESGQRITFSTSGSTGVPKRCTHQMASLQRETDFLAQHFAQSKRVFALTPPHHIYGFLFTAMLPSQLAIPVVPAEALSPSVLSRDLRAGDLVVSVPPRWEWLARSIPDWPSGVQGVTSTSPCPESLKANLMHNGLSGFTEIYGSSETAGVGLRTIPETRYSLMPFWRWAHHEEGSAQLQDSSGACITLQDRVEIAPDATFTVQARLDGAVQVGGVNVFPSRVEALLCSLSGVAQASVRLSTEPGRERLKAFIVPDHTMEEPTLALSLEQWTATFPAAERVRSFTFGAELPRNTMGKLVDWNDDDVR